MSQRNHPDLSLSSSVFPGGNILSAIFDRNLMRLSDRGGASGLIGDRWSDVCSEALASWPETTILTPDDQDLRVDRVVRLDEVPAVARAASRKKLQNPDFVIIGHIGGSQAMLSADAKFSVETAGASQVSADALTALMEIGPVISDHMGELDTGIAVLDGIFLSPDFSLTHYMLGRRRGYRSVSVDRRQIHLLPVASVPFLKPLEGARIIPVLAEVDGFDRESRTSLLVGLYYFRLVRAAIGCWSDMVTPLLGSKQPVTVDLPTIEEGTRGFARDAKSAWEVIDRWDAAAETVRSQREIVNRITSVPIVNRELREQLDAAVAIAQVEPPSMNKVRRRIGSWFRDQVVQRVGVLPPPVENFPAVIHELEMVAADVRLQLPEETTRIIAEMLAETMEADAIAAPVESND